MDLDEIKSRINPQYADVIGTESYERKLLCNEIESLREQLAAAQKETDSVVHARDEAYRMLAELERDVAPWRELQAENKILKEERDELQANALRYELLREMKLFEMMEYKCLPVPIEDAEDWFDAQTDAKIKERYPNSALTKEDK